MNGKVEWYFDLAYIQKQSKRKRGGNMLNKVKRILQWFIGGCYILSGLVYIGEYTMPAIILIILGGVIILPPITKRIPAFKFKKIALILLSSIVMIAGIQLGETNLSPEVLAKRKAESEAAAASQAALEAQEAAESASRAAEEEAASKAAQEKAESEAAVATENEIASMKAMILKDCNLTFCQCVSVCNLTHLCSCQIRVSKPICLS